VPSKESKTTHHSAGCAGSITTCLTHAHVWRCQLATSSTSGVPTLRASLPSIHVPSAHSYSAHSDASHSSALCAALLQISSPLLFMEPGLGGGLLKSVAWGRVGRARSPQRRRLGCVVPHHKRRLGCVVVPVSLSARSHSSCPSCVSCTSLAGSHTRAWATYRPATYTQGPGT
jgi:hypothetical protein